MQISRCNDQIVQFLDDTVKVLADEIDCGPRLVAAFEKDDAGNPASNRSDGVHLSSIIRYIMGREKAVYREKETTLEEIGKRNSRFAMGMAWEHLLSWAISQVFPHESRVLVGELESDGISMTPDHVGLNEALYLLDGVVVEEWKATWRSARHAATDAEFAENFKPWLWQLASYCRALGTCEGLIRVFFIMDDYSFNAVGKPYCWRVSFSEEDLDRNWEMILVNARELGVL